MASSSSSHVLSYPSLAGSSITQRGRHFVDEHQRVVSLRGFNVSGGSKIPARPNALETLDDDTWFDHRNVSFVGRPFPIEDARHHFGRLLTWGYPYVRFLLTWESLSHSGPSVSDLDSNFIDYVTSLMEIASGMGLKVVLCAHQDVFSRLSGGSGAPGWTLEAAGFDLRRLQQTGAAYVQNVEDANPKSGPSDPREVKGPFVWPSGYTKLAAATMATLFWAGEVFAWQHRLSAADGSDKTVNIQEYLQASYLEAFGTLADRIGHLPAVLGFEVINEPHRGFVGLQSGTEGRSGGKKRDGWNHWCYETDLHVGPFPSLLQSLALGEGHRQEVPYYVKTWPFPTKKSHMTVIDPQGQGCWAETKTESFDSAISRDKSNSTWKPQQSAECLWRRHGVWDWDEKSRRAIVKNRTYFEKDPRPDREGRSIEWYKDCHAPFIVKFAQRIQQRHSHLQIFFAGIPNEHHPPWPAHSVYSALSREDQTLFNSSVAAQRYSTSTSLLEIPRPAEGNLVYAPHFYDLNVLFSKVYKGIYSADVSALSRGGFLPLHIYFGQSGLIKNYTKQLRQLVKYARTSLGEIPIVIGEIGVPFDLNRIPGKAFSNDYRKQSNLLDALAIGMETAGVNGWTWWNYNPDNTTTRGDGWNGEDFSVTTGQQASPSSINNEQAGSDPLNRFSTDPMYAGGRCLDSIIRPYAIRLAGLPISTSFDRKTKTFELKYMEGLAIWEQRKKRREDQAARNGFASSAEGEDDSDLATIIYFPRYQYEGLEVDIQVSDGTFKLDRASQTLIYMPSHERTTPGAVHTLRIVAAGNDLNGGTWFRSPLWWRQARQRLGLGGLTDGDILLLLSVVLIALAGVWTMDQYVMKGLGETGGGQS